MMLSQKEQELLISQNIGLVVAQATKFSPTPLSGVEDYISCGYIGLVKAARNFDPKFNTKFSSYAWPCIRHEILSEIGRNHGINTCSLITEDSYGNDNDGSTFCINALSVTPPENYTDALPKLSKSEQRLLEMRASGYTLKEIGDEFGHTKEWTRKLINAIIAKIKKANGLNDEA